MKSPLPEPGAPLEHYVSEAAYDPASVEHNAGVTGPLAHASQTKLMWWYFRQHKIALASGIFLVLVYLSILFSEFLAHRTICIRVTPNTFTRRRHLCIFFATVVWFTPMCMGKQ